MWRKGERGAKGSLSLGSWLTHLINVDRVFLHRVVVHVIDISIALGLVGDVKPSQLRQRRWEVPRIAHLRSVGAGWGQGTRFSDTRFRHAKEQRCRRKTRERVVHARVHASACAASRKPTRKPRAIFITHHAFLGLVACHEVGQEVLARRAPREGARLASDLPRAVANMQHEKLTDRVWGVGCGVWDVGCEVRSASQMWDAR